MNSIKIFPYSLIRISPFCARELLFFNSPDAIEYVIHLNTIDKKIALFRQKICSELHQYIAHEMNDDERHFLLGLKRSIFNERKIPSISPFSIPQYIQSNIDNMLIECNNKQTLLESLSSFYKEKLHQERIYLKRIARSEKICKGLLLSSNNLLEQLENYNQTSPNSRKKGKQIEQGLLRYFTRSCLKTTPFSTFTSLSIATLKTVPSNESVFSKCILDNFNKQRSHVRLNNFILKYLILHFSNIPEVYQQFSLRINPTLRIKNGFYSFLLNVNNKEAFQKIEVEPEIEYVLKFLSKCPNENISICEITNQIIKSGDIDADFDEISTFLHKLILYGLLEIEWGVSGSDSNWDTKLKMRFQSFSKQSELCKKTIETLFQLRNLCEKYVDANISFRESILTTAVEYLRNLCSQLNNKVVKDNKNDENVFKQPLPGIFPFKKENIFLEDTSIAGEIELNSYKVTEVINSATKMIKKMELFDNRKNYKEILFRFFSRKYPNKTEIDLLQFYEDFSRESTFSDKGEEFDFERQADCKKLREKWQDIFVEELSKIQNTESDVINITDELLSIVNARLGYIPSEINKQSYTLMIQPSCYRENENNTQVFLFSIAPGYGKMTGRYYYMFEPQLHQKQLEYNSTLFEEELLAELTDANYFNANLHFSETESEISSAGSQHYLPLQKRISANELLVVKSGSTLNLVNKKNRKKVLPLDLGLQSIFQRSQLYQLLDKFSPATQIVYSPICHGVNHKYHENDRESVVMYPRIIYENHLVIQRRSWTVPRDKIPFRKTSETDLDFFIRVNQWRNYFLIPTYGFITLWIRNKNYTDEQILKRLKNDDYKPQYMDFTSPVMLLHFEKLITNVSDSLYIEEMWPDYNHLISFSDEPRACEIQIQCNI